MSQQEFDTYLNLLSNMLRLSRKQRAAIADEFRSHLEDRLEDLLARGMSREQAIEMALEEFGDAAGLAGQLTSVSSLSRKRWIMRVSSLSVAASVLLGIGILSFWPAAQQSIAPSYAVAQNVPNDPTSQPGATPAVKPAALTDKQIEDELTAKLNERIDIELIDVSLADALKRLQNEHNLQFFIDLAALRDSGIEPETTNVTIKLNQLSTRTALRLMLKSLSLTFVPRDGLITITTPDVADKEKLVRVYNCRDILFSRDHFLGTAPGTEGSVGTYEYSSPVAGGGSGGGGSGGGFFAIGDDVSTGPGSMTPQMGGMGGGMSGMGMGGMGGAGGMPGGMMQSAPRTAAPQGTHQQRAHHLMTLITTTVDKDSWSDVGGSGTIFEFDGLIAVNQTLAVHQEVESVLKMLREAAQTNPPRLTGQPSNMSGIMSMPGMPGMMRMEGMPGMPMPEMPGMPGMAAPGMMPGIPGFPGNTRPRTDSGYTQPGTDPNTGAPYSGSNPSGTPGVPGFNGPGGPGSSAPGTPFNPQGPQGAGPGSSAPPGGVGPPSGFPGSAGPAGTAPQGVPGASSAPGGLPGAGGFPGNGRGTNFGGAIPTQPAPAANVPGGPRFKKSKQATNNSVPAATPSVLPPSPQPQPQPGGLPPSSGSSLAPGAGTIPGVTEPPAGAGIPAGALPGGPLPGPSLPNVTPPSLEVTPDSAPRT